MNWFLLAFISAFFSAVSAVSEKKSLFTLSVLDFSFIVSTATLIFTLPFFALTDFSLIYSAEMQILLFKTLLGAVAFLCVMYSIKNLEISEALPLLALTPGLVAITGVIFINDSLTLIEWSGVILMLIGAYVLEMNNGNRKLLDPFRTLFSSSKYSYVFLALLLFTISSLLDRVLLKDYKLPPYTFMAFQQLFYAIIFTVIIISRRKTPILHIRNLDRNVIFLIVVIAVSTVIYRYTQIEATKLAPVALVLSVKRLSVLFAVIFGGRFFREKNLAIRVAALVIILAGTALLIK